jgi:hypothetical protein
MTENTDRTWLAPHTEYARTHRSTDEETEPEPRT